MSSSSSLRGGEPSRNRQTLRWLEEGYQSKLKIKTEMKLEGEQGRDTTGSKRKVVGEM